MRQKHRIRHRESTPAHDDLTPIDLGHTARQLALFETGNGWQHNVIGIALAVIVALVWLPLRSFLRSGSTHRR